MDVTEDMRLLSKWEIDSLLLITKTIATVSPPFWAIFQPQFPQGNMSMVWWCLHACSIILQERSSDIGETYSFIIDFKQTYLTLVLKGDIIFIMLDNK